MTFQAQRKLIPGFYYDTLSTLKLMSLAFKFDFSVGKKVVYRKLIFHPTSLVDKNLALFLNLLVL